MFPKGICKSNTQSVKSAVKVSCKYERGETAPGGLTISGTLVRNIAREMTPEEILLLNVQVCGNCAPITASRALKMPDAVLPSALERVVEAGVCVTLPRKGTLRKTAYTFTSSATSLKSLIWSKFM